MNLRKLYFYTALLLGIIIALSPVIVGEAYAVSSKHGRIFGQLLNGTHKNAPLAGQIVTLQMAQGQNSQDLATATTDAHGSYSFDNLATDKTIRYALYIRYQGGAHYISAIVALDSKAAQQMNLTVYEATSDASKLAVMRATVLLQKPDLQKGVLTVSEILVFKNLDIRTFVGSLDATKGRPKALFFSLPAGARNVNLDKGFDGYRSIASDRGFASDVAVLPGDSEFSFSFEIPYNTSSYDFRHVAMYPTVELLFLVPPEVHASSSTLTAQGSTAIGDQHPYKLYKAMQLPQSQEAHLQLEGLPAAATSTASSPLKTGSVWLIVGGLFALAALVVGCYLAQRRMRTMKHHKGEKGATTAKTDRQQELLAEMLELDKAFEAGELTEKAYHEKRSKTKALLRILMHEREIAKK